MQLTRPFAQSSGLLCYNKPFKFMEGKGNLAKPTSFSTAFSFSMSPGNGDGLTLVFIPHSFASNFVGQGSFGLSGENKYLGIEFDTKKDEKVADLNANHVGLNVGSLVSVSIRNASSMNLVLNNGEKLKSWVDYNPSSKNLEVRLSKLGEARPSNPFLAYNTDLLEMWRDENVFVGLVSTSTKTSQTTSVYSWRFRLKKFPTWMHSMPVDPRSYMAGGDEKLRAKERTFCPSKILGGLIFATGCGALLAFVLLFAWAIFVGRHMVLSMDGPMHPADFRYEKISIVVEKDGEESKDQRMK